MIYINERRKMDKEETQQQLIENWIGKYEKHVIERPDFKIEIPDFNYFKSYYNSIWTNTEDIEYGIYQLLEYEYKQYIKEKKQIKEKSLDDLIYKIMTEDI
jgi:uncharacterized membrane protein